MNFSTSLRELLFSGDAGRTYIQQLCADTGCSLEDLPGAMNDRDGWCERVEEIRTGGAI